MPFILQVAQRGRSRGAGVGRVFAFASIANQPHTLENRYIPGSGVGARSIANRRANMRRAAKLDSICPLKFGLYSNNPNGYIPCPYISPNPNAVANLNYTGMTPILGNDTDDVSEYLPFTGMDFYFFGTNYGDADDKIYMSSNYAFGFGTEPNTDYDDWDVEQPAILFGFLDVWNFESYVSSVATTPSGLKYLRIVAIGTDNINSQDPTIRRSFEIFFIRDAIYQYMQFNCAVENFDKSPYSSNTTTSYANGSNITDGTEFKGTFGDFSGPVSGKSYVIRSNLNGTDWQFFPETYVI